MLYFDAEDFFIISLSKTLVDLQIVAIGPSRRYNNFRTCSQIRNNRDTEVTIMYQNKEQTMENYAQYSE